QPLLGNSGGMRLSSLAWADAVFPSPKLVSRPRRTTMLARLSAFMRGTLVASALALCMASPALSQTAPSPFGDVAHHVVRVDGLRLHYVTAGSGGPGVLLPRWPGMSWVAWRKVIPLLVKAGRQVLVLEPRRVGASDKPQGGYDLDTAARDLHGFLASGLSRPGGVDIVAHDVGTWVAHAHAAAYPGDVKRLVLTESNVPGISAVPAG